MLGELRTVALVGCQVIFPPCSLTLGLDLSAPSLDLAKVGVVSLPRDPLAPTVTEHTGGVANSWQANKKPPRSPW